MISDQVPFAFAGGSAGADIDGLGDLLGPSGLTADGIQTVDISCRGGNEDIIAIDCRFEDGLWELRFPDDRSIFCGQAGDSATRCDRDDCIGIACCGESFRFAGPIPADEFAP